MNKIYDVTLASTTSECNIALHTRDEVEGLQNFIWDNTDCEMSVKTRKQKLPQGIFKNIEIDKLYLDGISGLSYEETEELNRINKHIESALHEAHKQLLKNAAKRIKGGEKIHSIDLKAGLSIVEEDEDDE
jgi:hypothetical protein